MQRRPHACAPIGLGRISVAAKTGEANSSDRSQVGERLADTLLLLARLCRGRAVYRQRTRWPRVFGGGFSAGRLLLELEDEPERASVQHGAHVAAHA
eukprot:2171219-Pleurochrysis_carterae.AAC.2